MRLLASYLYRLKIIDYTGTENQTFNVEKQYKRVETKDGYGNLFFDFLGCVVDRAAYSTALTNEEYGTKNDFDKVILTTSDLLGGADVYRYLIRISENKFIKIMGNAAGCKDYDNDTERDYNAYKIVRVCRSHGIIKILAKRVLWNIAAFDEVMDN